MWIMGTVTAGTKILGGRTGDQSNTMNSSKTKAHARYMGLSGARTYLFMLLVTCRQAHWLRLATADLADSLAS